MVNIKSPYRTTLLPNIKGIKFLADDFNPQDILDKTPKLNKLVMTACHSKDKNELVCSLNEVRNHIKENPSDLEKKDITGNTPLIVAAQLGKPQVVNILLFDGADINAQDKHGNTPMHHFINHGCGEGVELLLNKGADLTIRNEGGQQPLHAAATNINNNHEPDGEEPTVTERLLSKVSDIEEKDGKSHTAADLAYIYGNTHTFKTLLDAGAKVPDTSKVKFESYVKSKKKWVIEDTLRSHSNAEGMGESKEEDGRFVRQFNDRKKHRSHHISDMDLPPSHVNIYLKKTFSSRVIGELFDDGESKTNCR